VLSDALDAVTSADFDEECEEAVAAAEVVASFGVAGPLPELSYQTRVVGLCQSTSGEAIWH